VPEPAPDAALLDIEMPEMDGRPRHLRLPRTRPQGSQAPERRVRDRVGPWDRPDAGV